MKNIKIKSGFYIDDFSSTGSDIVMSKLTLFIKENQSKFSSINLDKENNQIIVSFKNEDDILDLIKTFDKNFLIEKNLNKQIRLNLKFNKETKSLELSNENVEKFNHHNEVIFSIDCSNLKNEDMLYFHESSLVNNTEEDFNEDLKNCKYKLILISYNEKEITYDKLTSKQNERNNQKYLYLCIDKTNDKIVEDIFESLNKDSNINIFDFIKRFNSDFALHKSLDYFKEVENTIITYRFSNFKMAESDFSLPNAKENDFLNFKAFVSYFIYETFMSNLKNKLENLW